MAAKSGFTFDDLQKLGPDALTRKRMLAEALLKQSSGIQDIRHPMQGMAQLAQALVGNIKEGRVDRAETRAKEGASAKWNELAASMGMGGAFPEAPSGGEQASAAPQQKPNATTWQDMAQGGDGSGGGDLVGGINSTAQALGIDPLDLATAISYETAGTFDPTKKGPTTQWGQHKGLIQFGEPQAQKYGVDWNDPMGSQLGPQGAIAKYLTDTGVKPGMGMMDIYSAINAGGVGRYGASDANNGGAPGTVADKVNDQMAGHRAKARALLMNAGGTQVAENIAPNNPGNIGMPDGSQAQGAFPPAPQQQQPWTPAQPIQAGGPDMNMLMQAAGDEWMNPSQRGVIEALIGQKMKPKEPKKFGFQAGKDGSIFRTDPETGQVEQVYGGKPAPGYRVLSPDEEVKMGLDPAGAYQMGGDDNKISKIGGDGTTVNIGAGETAFDKAAGAKQAETMEAMATEGLNANADLGVIGELEGLLAGQGGATTGVAGWLASRGIGGEGMDDLQATQALINQLVPTQRQPGSGSMSDRDVELFKASLPSLWNTPGGNQKILGVMKGLAEYKRKQGEIASAVLSGDLDRNDARRALQALPNPLAGLAKSSAKKAPVVIDGYTIEEVD